MLYEGVESVKADKLFGRDVCVGAEPAIALFTVMKRDNQLFSLLFHVAFATIRVAASFL